jgi:hypothetical protein
MPTTNGIPMMLAMDSGRFEAGCYHPVCEDCERDERQKSWQTMRDAERKARVVGKLFP